MTLTAYQAKQLIALGMHKLPADLADEVRRHMGWLAPASSHQKTGNG